MDKGIIYRSLNNGPWKNIKVPDEHCGGYILGINALDVNRLWVCGINEDGHSGHFLRSVDGGLHWLEMEPPLEYPLWRISLVGGAK